MSASSNRDLRIKIEFYYPSDRLFKGWLRSTYDAFLIIEAARRGIVPRVTRRFHDVEKRNEIQSGSIFVFTEEESGIKRWTDPFLWSASRMLGNFLIYREKIDEEAKAINPYLCFPLETESGAVIVDPLQEKDIYGSLSRGKGLKEDGLMKKTMSMKIEQVAYHVIAYYLPSDVRSGKLRTPSETLQLSSLRLSSEILSDLSQFRQPPVVEVKEDGTIHYIADRDERHSGSDYGPPLSYQIPTKPEPMPPAALSILPSEDLNHIASDQRRMHMHTQLPTYAPIRVSSPVPTHYIGTQSHHGQHVQHGSSLCAEEQLGQSCSTYNHRFQSRTEFWHSTYDYQMQNSLDQFRLAYNSPVFWDVPWAGPERTQEPQD